MTCRYAMEIPTNTWSNALPYAIHEIKDLASTLITLGFALCYISYLGLVPYALFSDTTYMYVLVKPHAPRVGYPRYYTRPSVNI